MSAMLLESKRSAVLGVISEVHRNLQRCIRVEARCMTLPGR